MDPNRNIGKHSKMLWIVALAAVLCMTAAALAACSNRAVESTPTPDVMAAITPSEKTIEPSPNPTAGPSVEIAADPPRVFANWTSRYTAWPNDGRPREFSGVMINGSREGNTLSISLAYKEEGGHYCSKIALSTEQGIWEAEFPSDLGTEPEYRYAEVQCADLDADGTDEIILFYAYGSTGGEGDLHIYRIESNGLKEIMTCYDDMWVRQQPWMKAAAAQPVSVSEQCAGVRVFLEDDYRLGLRVYHDCRATDPNRVDFAQIFSEYRLGGNGWEVIREYVMEIMADRLKAMRETLAGIVALDDEYHVYAYLDGSGFDLIGSGRVLDRVFCAVAHHNDVDATEYFTVETQLYGRQRELTALYQRKGKIVYNVMICDLDGDGVDEILITLGSSTNLSIQSDFNCSEMHLLKYMDGGFKETLSIVSNAPTIAEEYRDTLFMPQNIAGLAIPDGNWDSSFEWAERAALNGKYAIRLTHTYGGAIKGYSYLVFKDGSWKLELQSAEALD